MLLPVVGDASIVVIELIAAAGDHDWLDKCVDFSPHPSRIDIAVLLLHARRTGSVTFELIAVWTQRRWRGALEADAHKQA